MATPPRNAAGGAVRTSADNPMVAKQLKRDAERWIVKRVLELPGPTTQDSARIAELEKPNKYRNTKTDVDGIRFDSKKEAARWKHLKLLQDIRCIKNLERQVRFEIIPKCGKQRAAHYVADFVYQHRGSGKQFVEDCKGMRTDTYKLKKKLMLSVHGIEIHEV